MVNDFSETISSIERQKGSLGLFAVAKMDDLIDRWTILIGASWINDDNIKETFREIIDILKENSAMNDLNHIARIGIYSLDEHLIQDLLMYKEGTHITEQTRANGNLIHEAYIIKSKEL
jgi:hypothetical protein